MPKHGNRRKKTRTNKADGAGEKELKEIPRSFVVRQGPVTDKVKELIKDLRGVMSPNCAKALKESKINRLEDYLAVAGPLGVSHIIAITQTKLGTYLKLAKLPQGPTLTFRIMSYTLAREVRAAQKRPRLGSMDYAVPALQILNGFTTAATGSKASPRQLLVEMLRGLFPAVDVPNFKQGECKRAALFNYDAKEDHIVFRHYHITQGITGIERNVQKLMRTTRIPKLGKQGDIADYILGHGAASESEAEQTMEAPSSQGGKIAIRLSETGPRMTLNLIKVEEGICNGGVLYHRYMTKTPSQQAVLQAKARQRQRLNARNAKLEKDSQQKKAQKRKREEQKEAEAEAREGSRAPKAIETVDSNGVKTDAKAAKAAERFHPFGRKAKKGGGGGGAGGGEKKAGGGEKGSGKSSKGSGKGGGKGKGKGEGKGKKASPKDKKKAGRTSVMDRYRQSQKRKGK